MPAVSISAKQKRDGTVGWGGGSGIGGEVYKRSRIGVRAERLR